MMIVIEAGGGGREEEEERERYRERDRETERENEGRRCATIARTVIGARRTPVSDAPWQRRARARGVESVARITKSRGPRQLDAKTEERGSCARMFVCVGRNRRFSSAPRGAGLEASWG